MSVQHNTYLGPFVLIFNPPLDSFSEYFGCNNKKCAKHLNQSSLKFCPECGNKIQLVKSPSKVSMDFCPYKELNEKLSAPFSEYKPEAYRDYEILIPNVYFGLSRGTHGEDLEGVQIIDWDVNQSERGVFNKFFAKEIEYLTKKFGVMAVKVHWGMLNYYS